MPPELPRIPDRLFNVKDHGAIGDGTTDNTAAIRKTLDAARDAGGGTVVIPEGVFLSGPIELTTGMCLRIDKGAVLRMLPLGRYPAPPYGEGIPGTEHADAYADFISATGVSDVSVVGPGLIDGLGRPWWDAFREDKLDVKRPRMIRMLRVERVSILNLSLKDSPMFHVAVSFVRDLTVDGVTIDTPPDSPNTDGVDFKGSNIVVRNCRISTGDDNIAFGGPTSNVHIYDCTFGRGHGLSLGSYTRGGIRDVFVDNCAFELTESGLRGKSARGRGGPVENLTYSNIVMREVKMPISFSSFYNIKNRTPFMDAGEPVTELTPTWKNITFRNISSRTTGKHRRVAALWGLPEAPIENLTFENAQLEAPEAFQLFYAKNVVFTGDSDVVTSKERPFFLYEATNVVTPDGKSHTTGRELIEIGDLPPTADAPPPESE
ncbi:glycoside hydrolase family 28 protein [Candidatus Sumerlaeota bacterium]|nr:glycoside hydrolase family 28 protein [Candidatus Sumerlaeota bacterium]